MISKLSYLRQLTQSLWYILFMNTHLEKDQDKGNTINKGCIEELEGVGVFFLQFLIKLFLIFNLKEKLGTQSHICTNCIPNTILISRKFKFQNTFLVN